MKICIDAGHGGADPGAVGGFSYEKDVNLAIAQLLEAELEARGHWVVMCRRKDRSLSLQARAEHANRLGADLFISIHCNGSEAKSATGIECWTYPNSRKSIAYAQNIQASLTNRFPNARDRGVKSANFTVLRETAMPAVLIECEFITNSLKERVLNNPATQQAYAEAIAETLHV